MEGFNGEKPSTVLYHLTILKNNGSAFIGTQRFRDCTNNIEKCKSELATGTGWTKPEAVFLVRTSSNTYVLRSRDSQGQITLGTKGVTKAYMIGSGQAKASRNIDGTLESQVYSCAPPPTSSSRGGDEEYGGLFVRDAGELSRNRSSKLCTKVSSAPPSANRCRLGCTPATGSIRRSDPSALTSPNGSSTAGERGYLRESKTMPHTPNAADTTNAPKPTSTSAPANVLPSASSSLNPMNAFTPVHPA